MFRVSYEKNGIKNIKFFNQYVSALTYAIQLQNKGYIAKVG